MKTFLWREDGQILKDSVEEEWKWRSEGFIHPPPLPVTCCTLRFWFTASSFLKSQSQQQQNKGFTSGYTLHPEKKKKALMDVVYFPRLLLEDTFTHACVDARWQGGGSSSTWCAALRLKKQKTYESSGGPPTSHVVTSELLRLHVWVLNCWAETLEMKEDQRIFVTLSNEFRRAADYLLDVTRS